MLATLRRVTLVLFVLCACRGTMPALPIEELDGGTADAGAPDAGPPVPACAPTVPRTVPAELAVFPEEGETPYLSVLARAERNIRVMVYLMGTGGILDTLKRKAGEGKSVRVILDGDQPSNQRYYDELRSAGAEVIWHDQRFQFMHAKVIIVDEREAVVSSGNYSSFAIRRERNYAARIADPADIASLVQLFDSDWERRTPDLTCTRLLVSPVNARQRLLDFIASASTTLVIESMQFADSDVRNAVAARKQAGVDVRVILADPSWIDRNLEGAEFLKTRGIPVRYTTTPGMHAKAMLADGARAYVGSVNLSYTSLTQNREVGVILTEPAAAQEMSATFERDWTAATPF